MTQRRDNHRYRFSASGITDDLLRRLPTEPGVYLMKDAKDRVVYVGKAINLRTRVRQYFRASGDTRYFVVGGFLEAVVEDIETIVVNNEKEALLLENHLIKKHQPRFNVNLRDDKQYLVLRIDPKAKYPRVEVRRNIKDDGARYFGPYHSATSCRETLRTLNRHFQLRTCTDHVLNTRKRVCLQYQIKRCPGPCVYPISEDDYGEQVDDVSMFLAGKNDELVTRLRQRMQERSDAEEYEAAAQVRDSLVAVERSLAKQHVVQDSFIDQDIFGLHRQGDAVELSVLFVRAGKLVGNRNFRLRDQEFSDAVVMAGFVQQYYATGTLIPAEVIVPHKLDNHILLEQWLRGTKGKQVKIIASQRGHKRKLLELARKNAEHHAASNRAQEQDTQARLEKLQKRLRLTRYPERIECFDIAHIQGTSTVASMVVFIDGKPDKSLYRRFKVRDATNDDTASMYEVITRRLKRGLEAESDSDKIAWRFPGLLVVDGGKGQLNAAVTAARETGAIDRLDLVSLAKERTLTTGDFPDRVYLQNSKDAIQLRRNTAELYLLAQLRDEAHRFANQFHRKSRTKASLTTELTNIPGIGKTRSRNLLRALGSVAAIKSASPDQLAAVPGMTAKAIAALQSYFADREGR